MKEYKGIATLYSLDTILIPCEKDTNEPSFISITKEDYTNSDWTEMCEHFGLDSSVDTIRIEFNKNNIRGYTNKRINKTEV